MSPLTRGCHQHLFRGTSHRGQCLAPRGVEFGEHVIQQQHGSVPSEERSSSYAASRSDNAIDHDSP